MKVVAGYTVGLAVDASTILCAYVFLVISKETLFNCLFTKSFDNRKLQSDKMFCCCFHTTL